MIKVKEYLNDLELFVKTEKDNIKKMEDSGIYNEGLISKERKNSHERIQRKHEECKDLVNQRIDTKIAEAIKENTYSAEIMDSSYQTYQSNVLTKVQILDSVLTVEMLQGMLQPIIERKDILTLEAIRNSIQKKSTISDSAKKKELLSCIPLYDDKVKRLNDARETIVHLLDSNAFEHANLFGVIGLKFLEQSGIFNI